MSEELNISPELTADVESAMPDFIFLPDKTAPWWFEMAHAYVEALGLDDLHRQHCLEPRLDDPQMMEKLATSAEQLMTAIRAWLVEHDVPHLALWWQCTTADGAFFHSDLRGTAPALSAD